MRYIINNLIVPLILCLLNSDSKAFTQKGWSIAIWHKAGQLPSVPVSLLKFYRNPIELSCSNGKRVDPFPISGHLKF